MKNFKVPVSRLLAVSLIIITCFSNSDFVKASTKVVATSLGMVDITENDVSKDLYLGSIIALNGKYFGIINSSHFSDYLAVSTDLENWDIVSKYGRMVYGNDKFFAFNYLNNQFFKSSDGVNWEQIEIDIKEPRIKFKDGYFILLSDEKCLFSKDLEKWYDVKGDLPVAGAGGQVLPYQNGFLASVYQTDKDGKVRYDVYETKDITTENISWTKKYTYNGQANFGVEEGRVSFSYWDETSKSLYFYSTDLVKWELKDSDSYKEMLSPQVNHKTYFVNGEFQSIDISSVMKPRYPEFSGNTVRTVIVSGIEVDGQTIGLEIVSYKKDGQISTDSVVHTSKDGGATWSSVVAIITLDGKTVNDKPTKVPMPTDIDELSWAKDSIEDTVKNSYILYENNKFEPRKAATRGEFLGALMRSMYLDTIIPERTSEYYQREFHDHYDSPYRRHIENALLLELVNGVGDRKFAPNDNIKRQDSMVMLYNVLNKLGYIKESKNLKALDSFSDKNEISDYAKKGIASLVDNKIISGSDGKINPNANVNRAELSTIIYNVNKLGDRLKIKLTN